MKRFFTLALILINIACFGQDFNNEWITDYSKTYYKFKVGSNGLYRISQLSLDTTGLGATPVQQFKLFRNGKEVPLYTSVASGPLPVNGFIEFWGEANDGKADLPLYRDPKFQHSSRWSLETDTAVYFLTVSTGPNLRYADAVNDVASNVLPAESYFMYSYKHHYREMINHGLAAVVGEYVYSSSYDQGEFWSSQDIWTNATRREGAANLFHHPGGGQATLTVGAAGNAVNTRNLNVSVNNVLIKDTVINLFNDVIASATFPVTLLNSGVNLIDFRNVIVQPPPPAEQITDRMVLSFFEINYPRQFNFGGNKNFGFELPAKATGSYLAITNFSHGTQDAVLYDLTSHRRYIGVNAGDTVKFVLPPSVATRQFVLVSHETSNIQQARKFVPKVFTNYTDVDNQGDYLIISNPILYRSPDGRNPVEEYRLYRRSKPGGEFNAKVYDINDLVDQFAFGIKKHPLSVKNFLRFARAKFSASPKFTFMIGRGVDYMDYRYNEADVFADQLNLVPSFGYPASDNLLSSADGGTSTILTPIGRLSVVNTKEIDDYLEKVKEYESAQANAPNTIAGRLWMKNVIHVTGASDSYLGTVLCNYMEAYKQIIQDTLTGASVTVFCKNSTNPVEQLSNERIGELFEEGLSLVTYFGHSSSTTLEFNLDNPQNYYNPGKYPVFSVNGCNAGNFFTFDPQRFTFNETLSEKFVLAKQRGGIAFIASTHFGIVNYLNIYINSMYNDMASKEFGLSIGEINRDALQSVVNVTGSTDYYARLHSEEITLHGDPAIKLNFQVLPDYVIEEPQVKITPSFISIAENKFDLSLKIFNLGKAIKDSITVEVKRQYPDGTIDSVYRAKIRGVYYSDSLNIEVPVISTRDKGVNKLIITIDADNDVTEVTENNNTITKEIFIYEDEAKPAFPYNYAIVNNSAQKLFASTANPLSSAKDYVLELDTTAEYNSSMKVVKTVNASGGIIEFDPGIGFTDSTVYYWRTSLVPAPGGDYRWSNSSFIYIKNSEPGFNQSHFFQHLNSRTERISLSADRQWRFGTRNNNLFIRNSVYPTAGTTDGDFTVSVNGETYMYSACVGQSLIFTVFDPITFKPWKNTDASGNNLYLSGSGPANCAYGRDYNFEWSYMTAVERNKMKRFMDSIPNGFYVAVRNIPFNYDAGNTYAAEWKKDDLLYGANNTLYDRLKDAGLPVDSFYRPRVFAMVYKKGDVSYAAKQIFSEGIYDRIVLPADCPTPDTIGYITSPKFGPAKQWKQFHWRGSSMEANSADDPTIDIIGINAAGQESKLYTLNKFVEDFDLSSINPATYPYLQLKMRNIDSVTLTPYQLRYWKLDYEPIPEGALAPNLFFTTKDTLEVGEKLNFGIAFKNISAISFDSITVKVTIIDKSNVPHVLTLPKTKPLIANDTVLLKYQIDTKDFPEMNTLYVDINPNEDQPEQYHYNNFLYHNFYVKPDNTNPLMDVTFDGVHILNRDIVSARPHIQIKVTDEAKFMLMNDTSIIKTIEVKYPDQNNTVRKFKFDSDTLRFIPASDANKNTATIDFSPYFPQILGSDGQPLHPEGDDYELTVRGTDRSGNKAGQVEYRVAFRVINKPMISNLFNYPNPFTTSTAFVFTITGSEIPQNMKIQILTVTGKVVREITKDELGPLYIGRNVTEFKWDGTDQYGQRLANGVYLYRVVTSLNGKKLDQFKIEGETTDRYFNKGYGKMYLMR